MKPDPVDATPERIAKGDPSERVDVAIEKAGDRGLTTRRFAATHLDRLWKNNRLTWRQHNAGDWYRTAYQRAGMGGRTVANYQPAIGGGEQAYGMPRSEAQARARQQWRQAREAIPVEMRGFLDRLLLQDELPRYGGRAAMRNIADIGKGLDALADWLRVPANS